MKYRRALIAVLVLALSPLAAAESIEFEPDLDNTLIEWPLGFLSNAKGNSFYVGHTFLTRPEGQRLRRGLIRFDIAGNVPPGATINSVEIKLYVMKRHMAETEDRLIQFHRAEQEWGEGTSSSAGGGGDSTSDGDASWVHAISPDKFWNNAGGDYSSTVSTSAMIGGVAYYTFPSTPQLVADIQDMLDNPEGNFGWILIGDKSTVRTTRRFGSREHRLVEWRPKILIDFDAPAEELCKRGGVNLSSGSREDVLTINGSRGDGARVVTVATGESIAVDMLASTAGPSPAPFAVYLWLGEADSSTVTPLPKNLTDLCFPILVTGGTPQPFRTWNNIGRFTKLGAPDFPSSSAPSNLITVPMGGDSAATATIQGILVDDGSAADAPASVTNAVVLKIVEGG